ncbi:MAG: lytic transglycosylase domain-containing protein [Clostridiales bacterium]|nr:lytic transglycosylase domain-containing protein [Clostridiales bacterium]
MQKRHSPKELVLEILIFFVILAAVVLAFSSDALSEIFGKIEYQRKYTEYVESAAEEFGVDENLIYAIIKAESNFDKDAFSVAGAVGLMQLVPDTYMKDIRTFLGIPGGEEMLREPEVNIRAGTYYFSHWLNYFGSVRSALCAYNAGIGRTLAWLENTEMCDFDGELLVETIPYYETRMYISRVEYYYEMYSALYPSGHSDTQGSEYDAPLYITEEQAYAYAEKYGEMYGVDPCLVMAIINIESSFNAHALSSSFAMGLMQIKMPTYLGDIRPATHTSSDENALYDPETNVMAGTYYLHWLGERLSGTEEIIVAYYYGIGNVVRMLDSAEYSSDGEKLIYENIPNSSARTYLTRALREYEKYKLIYGEN